MTKVMRRRWAKMVAVSIVAAGVVLVASPAWASPGSHADEPETPATEATHEACEAGDADGMIAAMESLTEEDWQAMEEHMNGEHDEFMGAGMMGMGSMMH